MYLHSFTPGNENPCFSNESPCFTNKTQFPPTTTLMSVITPPLQCRSRNNLAIVAVRVCVWASVCVFLHRWCTIHVRVEGKPADPRVRLWEELNRWWLTHIMHIQSRLAKVVSLRKHTSTHHTIKLTTSCIHNFSCSVPMSPPLRLTLTRLADTRRVRAARPLTKSINGVERWKHVKDPPITSRRCGDPPRGTSRSLWIVRGLSPRPQKAPRSHCRSLTAAETTCIFYKQPSPLPGAKLTAFKYLLEPQCFASSADLALPLFHPLLLIKMA